MEGGFAVRDYKQDADGYWFPYSTSNVQTDTRYQKIDTMWGQGHSTYAMHEGRLAS
jgi:hypothetical protein